MNGINLLNLHLGNNVFTLVFMGLFLHFYYELGNTWKKKQLVFTEGGFNAFLSLVLHKITYLCLLKFIRVWKEKMRFRVVIQILGVSPAVSLFCGLCESQFKLQAKKNESNPWKPNLLKPAQVKVWNLCHELD